MPTIIPHRMLLVNRKMLIIHTFLRPRDWAHPNSPPGDLASVYQKSDRISKKGLMRAPPRVFIHVFLRVNNAWQDSNLGPERGGAQPSRQAAVVWREQFRGRVMRSKAVRPLAAAPAPHGATTNFACVAWRARGASECGRKGLHPSSHGGHSRRATAKYHPGYDGVPGGAQGLRALRIDYDQNYDQDFVGFDDARDEALEDSFQLPPPKKQSCPFYDTHPLAPRSERGASDIGDAGLL